jgi:hypothetical protein
MPRHDTPGTTMVPIRVPMTSKSRLRWVIPTISEANWRIAPSSDLTTVVARS